MQSSQDIVDWLDHDVRNSLPIQLQAEFKVKAWDMLQVKEIENENVFNQIVQTSCNIFLLFQPHFAQLDGFGNRLAYAYAEALIACMLETKQTPGNILIGMPDVLATQVNNEAKLKKERINGFFEQVDKLSLNASSKIKTSLKTLVKPTREARLSEIQALRTWWLESGGSI